MGEELNWSESEKTKQMEMAVNFLQTQMGKDANRNAKENMPITLTQNEIKEYVKRFNNLDREKKGYLTIKDIRLQMQVCIAKSIDINEFKMLIGVYFGAPQKSKNVKLSSRFCQT